ncbi:DUF2306 domain-containing protein [Paenibacillus sedimenti]|uniref:DUF2306 domain-containing protein n=1 Tax=Paenibacillus sedimenti TaxID=2770274 RepID=A0A926KPR6_9BACL|nr:DUF2306 domain-containing protein [Paenibacillus sedimenti]MBD0379994.1 DUF2306 domain-containing protein [Paenibacillus sedimenti]
MKLSKSRWLLIIVSLGVIIPFMAPYLTFDPSMSRVPITSTSIQYPVLVGHILFAFIALVSGFFQFIDRIRIHKPIIHRYLGRIYVCSVFISGLLALVVIFYIEDFSKAISFLALSLIWLFTTWKGYRTAVRKRFDEHKKWMIRSFGMTLVAVSGRVLVPVLLFAYYTLNVFSLPGGREKMIEEVLNVNIWAGIILNFIIIEWMILKSSKTQK